MLLIYFYAFPFMDQAFTPKTVAGMNISVSTTAALLTSLIETASVGTVITWPTDPNTLYIKPENGDIRVSFHPTLTPTTLLGFLIKQGENFPLVFRRLKEMKIVAVSGTVKCSLDIGVTV
jgi:hypothetical protein